MRNSSEIFFFFLKGRKIAIPPLYWFILPMPAAALAASDKASSLELMAGCPCGWQGPGCSMILCHLLPPRVHSSRKLEL